MITLRKEFPTRSSLRLLLIAKGDRCNPRLVCHKQESRGQPKLSQAPLAAKQAAEIAHWLYRQDQAGDLS